MCTRAAARPKCSSSATATKYRRWRSSILQRYHSMDNKILDIDVKVLIDFSMEWIPGTRASTRSARTDHAAWPALGAVALATLLNPLNTSMIVVALVDVRRSFAVETGASTWL